jgi:hypothetical protein
MFQGLPISGDPAFARRSGFRDCIHLDSVHIRCRRGNMRVFGMGPFEAAVDLSGADGESGFDRLTLWREGDQDALYRVVVPLTRRGWRYCYTGTEQAGDQAIFTRPGEAVRISIDISYYGKRRLRILPNWNRTGTGGKCTPDDSVLRFGADVARAAQKVS